MEPGYPDPSSLDCGARLIMESAAATDVALRTVAATLVTGTMAPYALVTRDLSGERDALGFYRDLASRADPELSFPPPEPGCPVVAKESRRVPVLQKGRVELLSFESAFEPLNPELRAGWRDRRRNVTAWAQHWRHRVGPRPTLIQIHGFMGSPFLVNSAFFSLPWFYTHGYDVLLFTLPFHGRRKGWRDPYSGHGYFARGMSSFNEAVGQSIHDLRVFIDHLLATGVPRVGVTGLSLGGYTTALLASVDPRVHVAIPNAAVSNVADLSSSWFPASSLLEWVLPRRGVRIEELHEAMAFHSPLTYAPLVPKERRFIIGGLGDRLAPPSQSVALWEHWDKCRIHWYPGNHVLHVNRAAYLREMGRFLHDTGFSEGLASS